MNAARSCVHCGSVLPHRAGEDSLCPVCLMRTVLATDDENAGVTSKSVGSVGDEWDDQGLPEVGASVSHFDILERIGRGGMGVVYKARDRDLDRVVALKFLPPWLSTDAAAKARFIREARAASALDHINIATVFEVGEANGNPCFIAMAYYEGQTLAEKIGAGPLPVARAIAIAVQIANGLACAHARGVVHRDVKPGNVIITPDGGVKVLDFGLAKLSGAVTVTRPGTTGGTAAYMSPEQARGEAVDHRTDIWSLGVVLYEMLTGRRPFRGENAGVVLSAIQRETPPRLGSLCPDLPVALGELVDRCLAKEPAERPSSIAAVAAELRAVYATGLTGFAWGVRRVWRLRRARTWALAAVGAVALALGAVWFVRNYTVVGSPRIDSVAVLPFRDLAGDPEQAYFADGMHEMLIGELAGISGLRVISGQSMRRLAGTQLTIPEIAQQLNVAAVVTASVVREKQTVHLSVHLVEARPAERERWSAAFSDDLANVVTMHRGVARMIAHEIHVSLTSDEKERLTQSRPISAASYEAYLKGMHFLNKGTTEDRERAITLLAEAVDKNPADPYAYVGLAHGYLTLAHGISNDPDPLGKARAALDRALRLDPTLPEAQTASALLKLYFEYDLPGFVETCGLALKLNPNSAAMYYHRAWYHVLVGDFDQALADHYRARDLDPLSPLHVEWIPTIYVSFGRYEEGLACAEEISRQYPENCRILFAQGMCEAQLGHMDRAIAYHERMAAANPGYQWALGSTYARAGRTDEARRIQAEWEAQPPTPWNIYGRAALAANLGDLDAAFRWLEHRPAMAFVPWTGSLPIFSPMYGDPRFAAFLESRHLPPLRGHGASVATM